MSPAGLTTARLTRLDRPVRLGPSSLYGWQTLTANAQYEAVLDGPHELLFSVGVDRQFGGTGAERVQRRVFSGVGATTPSFYFGKRWATLMGYLRPLAVAGTFGYLIADKSRNLIQFFSRSQFTS